MSKLIRIVKLSYLREEAGWKPGSKTPTLELDLLVGTASTTAESMRKGLAQ